MLLFIGDFIVWSNLSVKLLSKQLIIAQTIANGIK
jgi:hypothetical protein